MSDTATLNRLFAGIEADLALDRCNNVLSPNAAGAVAYLTSDEAADPAPMEARRPC